MHIFLSSDYEGRPLSSRAATPITCLGHRTVLARFLARSRDIRSRARPLIRSLLPFPVRNCVVNSQICVETVAHNLWDWQPVYNKIAEILLIKGALLSPAVA